LQFSLQAASPKTFGYTLVQYKEQESMILNIQYREMELMILDIQYTEQEITILDME
jgi:hypothetical protein